MSLRSDTRDSSVVECVFRTHFQESSSNEIGSKGKANSPAPRFVPVNRLCRIVGLTAFPSHERER